ncbi:tachykinin-4 precursor [Silurus meridionalis]|nr:tachykinin-4 precursor [Silurus meridionalis]
MELFKFSILAFAIYAQLHTGASSFNEDTDVWSLENWQGDPAESGFSLRFNDLLKHSKSHQFHGLMGRSLAPERENGFVKVKKGDSLTMECTTTDTKFDNLELLARIPNKHVVMVFDKNTDSKNLGMEYSGRVTSSGTIDKLSITIINLQLNESGLYIGIYSKYDLGQQQIVKEEGCSVLLVVNDVDKTPPATGKGAFAMSVPLILIFALTACTMVIVFILVMWVLAPKPISKSSAACGCGDADAGTSDAMANFSSTSTAPSSILNKCLKTDPSLAVSAPVSAAPERENGFVKVKKGDSLTMECTTTDTKFDNLELLARIPNKHVVMVFDKNTDSKNLGMEYSGRVTSSGTIDKLSITISNLQLNESGLYIGIYSKYDLGQQQIVKEEGCSVLLFVNDVDKTSPPEKSTGKGAFTLSEPLILIFALTACTMVIVFFLVMWVLAPKVKALCVTRADDTPREYIPVYEDMHRVRK